MPHTERPSADDEIVDTHLRLRRRTHKQLLELQRRERVRLGFRVPLTVILERVVDAGLGAYRPIDA